MTYEPKIRVLLDLSDGQPPIECGSLQEAQFLEDIWRAFHGDAFALMRARQRQRDLRLRT